MSVETAIIETIPFAPQIEAEPSKKNIADDIYHWVLLAAAFSVVLIIAGTIYELTMGSRQSIATFGLRFFTDSDWDPGVITSARFRLFWERCIRRSGRSLLRCR